MKKKLLTTIFCLTLCFIITSKAFGAIATATAWEVRTTGAATNGGGYSSGGTDYSQQDAAQLTLTDGATSGVGVTTFTSATGGFTSAMVGNLLYISSGTNTLEQYFEITVYTDTNTVTLDRAPDDGVGAVSGANFKVGGAVDHPNTISASVVAGNTIYIQNGTYVKVGANAYILTLSVSGGNGTPITWIGYITNHTTIPTGTNRPYFDGDSDNNGTNDTTNILSTVSYAGNVFKNFRFGRSTAAVVTQGASSIVFHNCSFFNGTDALAASSTASNRLINCEVYLNSDSAEDYTANGTGEWINCYIHDQTNEGVSKPGASSHLRVINSIIESNGGPGINHANTSTICIGNILSNNTGATTDGFKHSTSATVGPYVFNTSSIDNGQYGFNFSAVSPSVPTYFDYNNYNGNGTAGTNGLTAGVNDNTNDPAFTGAATGDFTVTSADTALLDKGTPDTNWAASVGLTAGDYQWNIGVDQDDNTAAGGGGGIGWVTMSH